MSVSYLGTRKVEGHEWHVAGCGYEPPRLSGLAGTAALASLEAIKAAAVMLSVHKIKHSVLLSGEMPCRSTSRVVVSLQTLSRACWLSRKIVRKPLPSSSRA